MAKKKADAHHGGAWKVAYADFVTAMMALFLVLWISAQDQEILIATSRYFKQPFNAMTDRSVGIMKDKSGGPVGRDKPRNTSSPANLSFMNALASELSKMFDVTDAPTDDDNIAEIELTSDELRLTLYDRAAKPLFEPGTSKLTEWGRLVMQNLAWIVDRNHLSVYIDGYTSASMVNKRTSPGAGDQEFGPWELSADRANTARRTLEHYAVDPKMIERVTGYGDRRPVPDKDPASDANDRITISLSVHRDKK